MPPAPKLTGVQMAVSIGAMSVITIGSLALHFAMGVMLPHIKIDGHPVALEKTKNVEADVGEIKDDVEILKTDVTVIGQDVKHLVKITEENNK